MFTKQLRRNGLHNPVVACVYYIATAVSVVQPFLHGANTPHYSKTKSHIIASSNCLTTNQPANKPGSQPTNQSTNQSVNQPTNYMEQDSS
jgi:hypothetical protein